MSKKVVSIHFEKELTDIEYDEFFKFLSKNEEIDIFKSFKGQIFNLDIKCKKCKNSIRDMILKKVLVCPCCFETFFKIIERKKLKPTLLYSDFIGRFLTNDFGKYKGKCPEYTKEFFKNKSIIFDLEKELDYNIEKEEFLKCEILKNNIDDLKKKNIRLGRKINE